MNIKYNQIAPRLRGHWVALAEDEATVLGSGKTAEEAFAKAQKKRPETLIITHLPEDEIPNDDLLAAIREAEEEERNGNLTYYSTIDEMMAALE